MAHELDRELAVYRRLLPGMLPQHEGQWVLIHGDDVTGSWPSEADAYDGGCDRFGLDLFLVMPVTPPERPHPVLYTPEPNVPPHLAPCPQGHAIVSAVLSLAP